METHNKKPLDDFNWEEFVKGTYSQASPISTKKYDEEPVFHQGIAIVKRNGKYGAIMVGGKEIIPPIYDALTEFEDGLAIAKYKDEERVINLSGQIQVNNGDKTVFLPNEYNWGYDFIEDICIVMKDNLLGIIDCNMNIKIKPSYADYIGIKNNHLLFRNWDRYDIINKEGHICYSNATMLKNGAFIVPSNIEEKFAYGVIDKDYQEIIPFIFSYITNHRNNDNKDEGDFLLAKNESERILYSIDGIKFCCFNTDEYIEDIRQEANFVIVSKKTCKNNKTRYETLVYYKTGELLTALDTAIITFKCFEHSVIFRSHFHNVFRISSNGLFLIDIQNNNGIFDLKLSSNCFPSHIRSDISLEKYDGILGIRVSDEYLHYIFNKIDNENYDVINTQKGLHGISDSSGKILIEPAYISINKWKDNTFVASKVLSGDTKDYILYGVINSCGNIILPFEYSYLEVLKSDGLIYSLGEKSEVKLRFSYYNNNYPIWKQNEPQKRNIGLINSQLIKICPDSYTSIDIISDGFYKVCLQKYGIMNSEGKTITPLKYDNVRAFHSEDSIAIVETTIRNNSNNKTLANQINVSGEYVVSSYSGKKVYISSYRYDWCSDFNKDGYAEVFRRGTYGKINQDGQFVINFCGGLFNIPNEYIIGIESSIGFFRVFKEEGWGIINQKFELLVPCEYAFIGDFHGGFAVVAKGDTIAYDVEKETYRSGLKYGLIDTLGNTVLPVEYDYITKWDNDYYCVLTNNHYILLSPSLHPVFNTEKRLEKMDDRYILISEGYTKYGLIDFNGNEIIPTDGKHSFEKIEVLKNDFLKVIYHKGDYGSSHIGILNKQGKNIYENYHCDDIRLLDNGFIIVEQQQQYNRPTYYSLANLQGKEILPNSYYVIKFLNNGLLSIRNYGGWGLADVRGNIIIEPRYIDEIIFEDGFSKIQVKGASFTQKINKVGSIFVHNGKNEVELPDSVYWGTDFIHRISIVRGKMGHYDVIGVINTKGKIIIPTKYKRISLLSNKTISVQEGDCYGIFDLKGNTIFPPIFTSIEYINDDRIRVTWNLRITEEWDNKHDYAGDKYKRYDNNYLVGNRSALCNFKGEIINDKTFIGVGKVVNQYACAYKEKRLEIVKEDGQIREIIRCSQIGIIDLLGNVIVEPIYDCINLYDGTLYAKVRKDGKYGIIHIPSGSMHMFDDMDIKYMWKLDQHGRGLFSEESYYNEYNKEWKPSGNVGVLSIKGVLIPLGKYSNISLLDNGLIKVSNEKGNLYGLLNKDGKELLPLQYSYISSFKGGYATICLGGVRNNNYPYNYIGGKWGVIDNTGRFVKECESDEEDILEEDKYNNEKTENQAPFKEPSVILSDRIPKTKENNSYDYNHDSYRDDDAEGSYSKYGGYNGWDDNTIDEAFDGISELTWNID